MAFFASRANSHENTEFSPCETVHGKHLRTPSTIVYDNWLAPENSDPRVVEYMLSLVIRNNVKCWQQVVWLRIQLKKFFG